MGSFSLLSRRRRQRNAEEANASRNGKDRFEQGVAELFELASARDRGLTGAAAGDLPEVGELDLERDGAPANTGVLAVPPDLVDDLLQRIARSLIGEQIGRKRVFGADGFPYPIGADRPFVDTARASDSRSPPS